MYVSSINAFIANWLLLCLIKPLHSEADKSHIVPHKINNIEPVPVSEEQIHSNISKLSQYIYNRNQFNLVQKSKIPLNDPEAYKENVKKNVAKLISGYQLDQHYQETEKRDEEIIMKINILEKLLSESTDEHDIESKNTVEDNIITETSIPEETKRVVRQVRRHRPGFFYTLARLAFETFNDTRSAIQQISNIIGQNFEPDTTIKPSTISSNSLKINDATMITTPSNDQNDLPSNLASINVTTMTTTTTTTTAAPFKFTPNGFQNLIRRNLRGLVRLFNIEWQDALNQSEISVREFQKDLGNQIGSFLQDNPNAF